MEQTIQCSWNVRCSTFSVTIRSSPFPLNLIKCIISVSFPNGYYPPDVYTKCRKIYSNKHTNNPTNIEFQISKHLMTVGNLILLEYGGTIIRFLDYSCQTKVICMAICQNKSIAKLFLQILRVKLNIFLFINTSWDLFALTGRPNILWRLTKCEPFSYLDIR